MPIRSPEQLAAGISPGGEGGQWPRGPVAVSPADEDFLLLPIDVGGLYRSLDGGANWEMAIVGWHPRGANGFAIDPCNANRAVGIGANSMEWGEGWGDSPHGLYLSTNKAASWQHVLVTREGHGGVVAYDRYSFDVKQGYCLRVYYLSGKNGLLRSDDGGETWGRLMNAPEPGHHEGGAYGDGLETFPEMSLDGRNGTVYIGGAHGLFRTVDGGITWTQIRVEAVYGLSVAATGLVYVSGPEKVSVSHDSGDTWSQPACEGLDNSGDRRVQDIAVSPVDPDRALCWTSGANFSWPRYVTHNGGETWQKVTLHKGDAVLPMNARQGLQAWSAKDPDVAWGLGGDYVMKSTDGGRTFHWSNNGYNGIMTGGLFAFNVFEPDLIFLGFQDYNGAFTTDGGLTWDYRDIAGKGWGGHEYGAFALNRQVMWAGDADGWEAPRRLRLTKDGGTTWNHVSNDDGELLAFRGPSVSYGDPGDPRVGFAGSLRTADGGMTWASMDACDGVFTHDAATLTLYGKQGDNIVSSTNHGVDWTIVAQVEGGFHDLARDHVRGVVYAASQDRLKAWDGNAWRIVETPRDQRGKERIRTVAIDPRNPAVLYVGGSRDVYTSHATVCRSTDAGVTWINLTVIVPLSESIGDGPHEVNAIRVHPVTREAWAAGGCFGLYRIAPPSAGETGFSVEDASAPRAIVPPGVTPYTPGEETGRVSSADVDGDHMIVLGELLRVVQLYNANGHHPCDTGEDSFCPGRQFVA
jgi:hypothetical protein